MKNIHLLPTDKPSRLVLDSINNNLFLTTTKSFPSDIMKFKNIYITSNEEIKEGDWVFDLDTKRIVKADSFKVTTSKKSQCWYYKKIILTTDQDLINDGVQAIDDEFLEWFVKNPSCEEVMIETFMNREYEWGDDGSSGHTNFYMRQRYKIIIPKEEPKPFKQMEQLTEVDWEKFKKSPFPSKKVPKQETLEEVSERFSNQFLNNGDNSEFEAQAALLGVNFGAKWQQERMYSEEEVFKLLKEFNKQTLQLQKLKLGNNFNVKEWFEQFKKK